jgi:hypothetical protein
MLYKDGSIFHDGADMALPALVSHVSAAYGTESGQIEELSRKIADKPEALFAFTEDMQKIDLLVSVMETEYGGDEDRGMEKLRAISGAYAALRNAALQKALSGQLHPAVTEE